MVKDTHTSLEDGPNFIGKTMSGKITQYNGEDMVDGLNMVTNFVPKVGNGIGIGFSVASSELAAQREERNIKRRLGLSNLSSASYLPAVKEKLSDLRSRWKEGAASATGGLGGALGAGALATAIMGGPPGMIAGLIVGGAGGIAGGWGGSKIYKAIAGRGQDPIAIISQITDARAQKQDVPEEVVFAALAANLRGKAGQDAAQKLRKAAGTRYFDDAVNDGKLDALKELMQDQQILRDIRTQTSMRRDITDLSKSVVTQFAELINSDQLSAPRLLRRYSPLLLKRQPMRQESMMADDAPGYPSSLPNLGSMNLGKPR